MEHNQKDISLIRQYLKGELDGRAMYDVERRAEHDPVFRDLMLGMELSEEGQEGKDLLAIEEMISARTEPGKIKRIIPWRILGIAASIAVAVVTALLWLGKIQDNIPEKAPVSHKPDIVKTVPLKPVPQIVRVDSDARGQVLVRTKIQKHRVKQGRRKAPVLSPDRVIDTLAADYAALKNNLYKEKPALQEFVITAQGLSREKAEIAASQTTLKPDSISKTLLGKVAGISIESRKSNASVYIRGNTTFRQDSFLLQKDKIGGSNTNALNEVVVVRRVRQGSKPEPIIGWQIYGEYLRVAALPIKDKEGTVKLEFQLDDQGRPVQIKVKKSLSAKTDEWAIKMLTAGSKWTGGQPNQVIRLKIKFHL